jgi:hypothetical protein
MYLLSLQQGGYPFGRNELTVEEWLSIGRLKSEAEIVKHDP